MTPITYELVPIHARNWASWHIPSTPSLLNGPNPHPTLIRMDSNSLEQAIQTVQGILNSTLTVNLNGGIRQSLTYLVTFWMQILRHVVCTSHIWFRNATNFTIYRASTILKSLNVFPHQTSHLILKPDYVTQTNGTIQIGAGLLWSSGMFCQHLEMLCHFLPTQVSIKPYQTLHGH